MSDTNGAIVFGEIFRYLAENPTEDRKAIAKKIVAIKRRLDFSGADMCAEDAMLALGVAKKGFGEFTEDGEIVLFEGEDY